VRVDDVRGVAGFVLPGDRVDVILIRTVPGSGSQENVSDVLLQHVKVLAVDQLVNERQETPTIAKAVTLELDTDQAQKVLLATNVGKLLLIPRWVGADQPIRCLPERVSKRDLTREEPVAAAAPAAAPAPRRPAHGDLPPQCSELMADDKPLPRNWPCQVFEARP